MSHPRRLGVRWDVFISPSGTKAKNATSCGNAFETNILLASPSGAKINVKFFFIYERLAKN
ncbi:hypothetical protein GCM10011384_39790 [Psychrobacillus lasiicapitis]|nr:hypothetical protein GCM10011384_39790 [Psychrobacillus lasiicapitis]